MSSPEKISKLDHAIQGVNSLQENRKVWTEGDDAEVVAQMIQDEAQELTEAVRESLITGDVFAVASELGDVLYLAMRLCEELGFDPADLIEMKVKRNSSKYPDAILNNGYSREKATKISKQSWTLMGGDKIWSHAYLDYLADVEDVEDVEKES